MLIVSQYTGKGLITFYNPTPFKIVKLHLVHRISVVSHLHFVYKLQVQSAGVGKPIHH